uniref:Uncharacterized protein n=1 Tax=Kalanchoe fedtschenkoi TaxID=63787 RepID=A0A7N0RIW8_KALFE
MHDQTTHHITMKQPCFSLLSISIILLSLLVALAAWNANARKDSGDYWKGVMKDEPMPAALEALILPIPNTSSSQSSLVKKPDCRHEDPTASHVKGKTFGYDIEPRPSVTVRPQVQQRIK